MRLYNMQFAEMSENDRKPLCDKINKMEKEYTVHITY